MINIIENGGKIMKNLIDLLNKQVANFGVLYTKFHNFHWFVYGKHFVTYHEFFEKLYDEAAENLDAVAERVLMLGGKPLASLKEFLENTSIVEATKQFTVDEMLKETLSDFQKINSEIQETIQVGQELGDEVTVDLLIGIAKDLQKHIWFIESMLK